MASRVLHLCAEASFWQFADANLGKLARAGFEVHAASRGASSSRHLAQLREITAHELPLLRALSPVEDLWALAVTSRMMQRLQPDLVHAHTPKGGLIGLLAARQNGIHRRVYHAHGLRYQSTQGPLRRLLITTEKMSCALAHLVVCVSPSVRTALVRDGIVSESKTRVLHHGSAQGIALCDPTTETACAASARRLLSQLKIPENSPRAVFVGRLCRDKGVERLPAIWRGVRERIPDAALLVVGDPDRTDPVDLQPLEEAPGVHCLGHLEDVRPALLAASVLLLPSSREGLPQCVLEAASMRVPAIVSDVTGCVDSVLPGKTGFVLPRDATASWVEATVRLLRDPAGTQAMGRCARDWVSEHFAPEPSFRALLELYEELGLMSAP